MSHDSPSNTHGSDEDLTIAERPIRSKTPMHDLEGKVAFITGGSSGIGLGIVQACVVAGMSVAFTFRTNRHLERAQKKLRSTNNKILPIRVDVTDGAAVEAAARSVIQAFGKIHLLVNNAGIDPEVPVSGASIEDLQWCMDVNVKGVFNSVRGFLPHLKAHGEGGHIVTTASINGLVVGSLWGLYSVSKFAVVGMMEALRSELRDTNIGVSVFCPGHVASEIGNSRRNRPTELGNRGVLDDAQRQQIDAFGKAIRTAALTGGGTLPMMDPMEAGERLLNGVRNNDLYILSHSEYAQAIRERNDAILASFPADTAPPPRISIARFERSSIYADVLCQKEALPPVATQAPASKG